MKTNSKKDDIFIITQNIKWLRDKNKLSLEEMSEILGISTNSLKKLESGILPKRLNLDFLFKIHSYFNIPPKDFVDRILNEYQNLFYQDCIHFWLVSLFLEVFVDIHAMRVRYNLTLFGYDMI